MNKVVLLCFMLLALGGNVVWAAVPAPQEVVQDTSARMVDALRKNRAVLDRDPSRLYELVNQIVLPNFDFDLMSRWVLGRAWQQATPEQRHRFTEEFRTLLVRIYAKALLEYSGEEIRVVAPPAAAGGSDTTMIRTEVKPITGQPIPSNYSMHFGNNTWKVYDVTVNGVSLVSNYRSTFASQIRSQGLDAVIADLQQRNGASGNR